MASFPLSFEKWHGCGNDFVVLERSGLSPSHDSQLAQDICHRRFGVGADGILIVEGDQESGWFMRMFNPDGSEGSMCGNGIRCFVKYLAATGREIRREYVVGTASGPVTVRNLPGDDVQVDMGPAKWSRGEIGMAGEPSSECVEEALEFGGSGSVGTAVSMGNPHWVEIIDEVNQEPLDHWGPIRERHPWFPGRTNAHRVNVVDRHTIRVEHWERGASATLACGSGACACAAVSCRLGRTDYPVTVHVPGGTLVISQDMRSSILMTGPALRLYGGNWHNCSSVP